MTDCDNARFKSQKGHPLFWLFSWVSSVTAYLETAHDCFFHNYFQFFNTQSVFHSTSHTHTLADDMTMLNNLSINK